MSGEHSASEDDGDVSVCVDSGVTEGFQRNLSVNLTATDGRASKCTPLFRSDSHCYLFKIAVEEGRASLGGAATPWPKMKRL